MEKINFVFLRSPVTSSTEFQDQQRKLFLDALNKNNDFEFCDDGENIFFIETGGTEEHFKKVYKDYKEPYLIVATNANNSLPASLEIATFLRNNNVKFVLFHGTPNEVKNQLINENKAYIRGNVHSLRVNNLLKDKRFGVIGKPSDWLIASDVNYKNVKSKLGAELIDISIEEFLNLYKEEQPILDLKIFKRLLNKKVNEETLKGALKIYSSIKFLILKYKLDGVTIRCFDLLTSIKNTSCLALAILNQEGYIATCEGDVPTMLSMAIIKTNYNQSSFQVNPSYVNIEKRYAYLAHCTLPIDMCKSIRFDTHFESGIGIGIKGKLRSENITIFKMNSNLLDYEIFKGKIVKNLNKKNLCRTQIKVKFEDDISDILNSPNGNHLVVFYGDHYNDLIEKIS